jgi:hypothetical protein
VRAGGGDRQPNDDYNGERGEQNSRRIATTMGHRRYFVIQPIVAVTSSALCRRGDVASCERIVDTLSGVIM